MMSGSNIHFEMAERGRALNYGGIGAIHLMGQRLGSLAADEVQESVKFSSREKLAVCKVVEGTVKLSPGRSQRAASLEVVG
jgi:hypothetical protein